MAGASDREARKHSGHYVESKSRLGRGIGSSQEKIGEISGLGSFKPLRIRPPWLIPAAQRRSPSPTGSGLVDRRAENASSQTR